MCTLENKITKLMVPLVGTENDSLIKFKSLRWISLKVGAKSIHLKSIHSTVTFEILFKTTHFSSFL